MKTSRWALVLALSAFVLPSCATTEDPVSQLPELPAEHAAHLAHARTAPVLITTPPSPEAPVPPEGDPTGGPPREQSCERFYVAQVIYPITVCYPGPDLRDQVVFTSGVTDDIGSDIIDRARQLQHFKLETFDGNEVQPPYHCVVRGGPWAARVTEIESCLPTAQSTWILTAHSIPTLTLAWIGTWKDIPSYPDLHVMMGSLVELEEKKKCNCCPGFAFCEGRCVIVDPELEPHEDPCEVIEQ